ncbi:hypothetical protein Tco_0030396, partial [Tanacetum coccineum]
LLRHSNPGEEQGLLFQKMKMLQRILPNRGGRSLTLMKIQISLWTSDDTELVLEEEEPTEVVDDQGSGEKGEKEVATPVNFQTYIRRRRGVSTASRLDSTAAEIGSTAGIKAKDKVQEDIHKASQEQDKQRVVTEADPTKVIDWSDPSVIRYHAQLNRPRSVAEVTKNICKYLCNQVGYKIRNFKGITYDDIRPIFENVWDQVHEFVPMDSELEIPRLKRKGQEVQEEPAKT